MRCIQNITLNCKEICVQSACSHGCIYLKLISVFLSYLYWSCLIHKCTYNSSSIHVHAFVCALLVSRGHDQPGLMTQHLKSTSISCYQKPFCFFPCAIFRATAKTSVHWCIRKCTAREGWVIRWVKQAAHFDPEERRLCPA